MDHIDEFFNHATDIIATLDRTTCAAMVDLIVDVRARGGRIFFVGSGGGAGHASHAVKRFPQDRRDRVLPPPPTNVSELTARINDDGWDSSYAQLAQGQPDPRPKTRSSSSPWAAEQQGKRTSP